MEIIQYKCVICFRNVTFIFIIRYISVCIYCTSVSSAFTAFRAPSDSEAHMDLPARLTLQRYRNDASAAKYEMNAVLKELKRHKKESDRVQLQQQLSIRGLKEQLAVAQQSLQQQVFLIWQLCSLQQSSSVWSRTKHLKLQSSSVTSSALSIGICRQGRASRTCGSCTGPNVPQYVCMPKHCVLADHGSPLSKGLSLKCHVELTKH